MRNTIQRLSLCDFAGQEPKEQQVLGAAEGAGEEGRIKAGPDPIVRI